MEEIILDSIVKNKCKIEYSFSYTDGLAKYFSGKPFEIIFPESIESVPNAVLSIPFVVNVLPIIWLADAILSVPELDKDFYESIPNFKKGYMDMYPESDWLGKVIVDNVADCAQPDASGSVAFFSGGLDATTTLLRHYEEKPELLVLWGADVKYDNSAGWNVMKKGLEDAALIFNLPLFTIHTSFREFDNEGNLHIAFSDKLKDGWWHGVKHGIGIIGQAAPFMWLHKLKTLYIASTFTAKNIGVRCASYPTIDEKVAFCGCNVLHDGFELNRQEKTHYVVERKKELNISVQLKVCWESQTGSNCSKCEKCYRTMVGFWIAGDNPAKYGFEFDEQTIFDDIYDLIALRSQIVSETWKDIKSALRSNWNLLKDTTYGKKFAWIKDFNFDDIESNQCRISYRKKMNKLSFKEKIAEAMPWLRKLYRKIMRKDK